MNTSSPTSKLPAYLAIVIGALLCLAGVAAAIGYLGLPLTGVGGGVLSSQLGQMAAIFLGLVCGPLAVYHGLRSASGASSSLFKPPPMYFFWIVFAVVLGLGNLLLNFNILPAYLFPPVFLLGAALPVLGVVAWAARRLGWPVTWRQAALALVGGATLSVLVAIVAETILSAVVYLLTAPLWYFGGPGLDTNLLTRLILSPAVLLFLFVTALQAPIPEEFAKALGLPVFGRGRIVNERQALLIGLAAGAGFAILENMLYEGLYAQSNGWSWGGVTLLRAVGAVLHPLGTGLIALGWFRAREGGAVKVLQAYALAVGLHTLWNGGFDALVYLTGLGSYGGLDPSFDLYGSAIGGLLAVYLIGLSLGLWWLLRRTVQRLAAGIDPEALTTAATAQPVSARLVAGWAFACALVLVPIGAALGGAWPQIAAVMFVGR